MELSTSTNIHQIYRGDGNHYSVFDSIEKIAAAGYKHVDVSFQSCCKADRELTQNNWRDWVKRIREKIEECGLTVGQTHSFYYTYHKAHYFEKLFFEEMKHRSIEASAMVGAKWCVVHPILKVENTEFIEETRDELMTFNKEYFKQYRDFAEKLGVGIAIENMYVGIFRGAEELSELCDSLDSPRVGLCWDTGHANISGQDQPKAIRSMGSRLHALHINDNDGKTDMHMAPGFGNILWAPIIKALRDINYADDFTYEIHKFSRGVPDCAKDMYLKFTFDYGNNLLLNM